MTAFWITLWIQVDAESELDPFYLELFKGLHATATL